MKDGVHVIHGDPDDLLYVEDTARSCATCNEVKRLQEFYYKRTTGSVTLDCRACGDKKHKTKLAMIEAKADHKLADALSRENARRALLDPAPRMADAVKEVMKHQGGADMVYKRTGRAIKKAMRSKDEDIARKSAMGMMALIGMAEKNQNESFDINSLSAEDRIDILMEPAKELILRDPEFRKALLNDPEVRKILLSDAGVEVIEAE